MNKLFRTGLTHAHSAFPHVKLATDAATMGWVEIDDHVRVGSVSDHYPEQLLYFCEVSWLVGAFYQSYFYTAPPSR